MTSSKYSSNEHTHHLLYKALLHNNPIPGAACVLGTVSAPLGLDNLLYKALLHNNPIPGAACVLRTVLAPLGLNNLFYA